MKISPIIAVPDLFRIYKHPDVLIFDASNGPDAKSNYENGHIEGAMFVDLNTQLADIKSDLSDGGRHPLPDAGSFARTLTELGISKNSHVIVYDDKNGSNAAARFWWMLKAVGHEKVQVLNGGLQEARKQGFSLIAGVEPVRKAAEQYRADKWIWPIASIDEVEAAARDKNYRVVDVRDKDRYDGITEPIDLIAGHIPGAVNIPFAENLDDEGLFLSPDELKDKYQVKFGDRNPENLIVHCGSGVSACHTILALAHAGMGQPKLYVGSWSEWSRKEKKIAKTNR